jgi:hypothetical protein
MLGDRGSVTAELAIAMPSVALVIAVTLGGFGLQIERLKLVAMAASSARGDPELQVRQLAQESDSKSSLQFDYLDDYVCVTASVDFVIASLPSIKVSERQCARKGGL